MQRLEKFAAWGIFLALIGATVSLICFASGAPMAMSDCGGNMQAASVCPFMSFALPAAIVNLMPLKIVSLSLVLVLFIVALFVAKKSSVSISNLTSYSNHLQQSDFANSFINPTLRLVARGVIHGKIFGS